VFDLSLGKFECQDQRSRSPGTNKRKTSESSPLTMHSKACAVLRTLHAAADDTIATGGDGVTAAHADGRLHAVYVW